VCNITIVKATFDTVTWYEGIHGYDNMSNKKALCDTLWDSWPEAADYQMDPQETPNINWFDMSPTNMNLVLNDALGAGVHPTYSNWYEAPDNIKWGSPSSGSANQKSWDTLAQSYNNDKSAFILHGKRVGPLTYTKNSAVHMVVWVIEKSRVAFRDKNLQLKDFFITYLPTGDITQIICSGRYKYDAIGWSIARSTFEVNEPFDNFLESVGTDLNDQEDRYFYGKNCPNIPPVMPKIPEDMPCTWALR